MAYKILIADDHSVVRHGTRLIIEETFPDVKVYEAGSVKQMAQILKADVFDLLILDINMPGGNSIHMLDLAKQKQNDLSILVFSAYDEKLYASRYLQAGASGYLHKHSSESLLKEAIVAVLETGHYVTQSLKEHIFNSLINKDEANVNPISLLSNREIEVAELLVQGLGGVEISDKLNIQTTTVSSHKKKIFEKLHVTNLPELIEKFRQYSLS
jgi:two-component system invasion response regulator UvrY